MEIFLAFLIGFIVMVAIIITTVESRRPPPPPVEPSPPEPPYTPGSITVEQAYNLWNRVSGDLTAKVPRLLYLKGRVDQLLDLLQYVSAEDPDRRTRLSMGLLQVSTELDTRIRQHREASSVTERLLTGYEKPQEKPEWWTGRYEEDWWTERNPSFYNCDYRCLDRLYNRPVGFFEERHQALRKQEEDIYLWGGK